MTRTLERFFAAVAAGDAKAVGDMLRAHPDCANARDPDGATPLHHAAFTSHQDIVDLLLAAGADVNARDTTHDATPAGWAMHYLRERGALLTVEIEDLLFAIERNDVAWAQRFLVRHPALVSATDRHGTPLSAHAAASPALSQLFHPATPSRE